MSEYNVYVLVTICFSLLVALFLAVRKLAQEWRRADEEVLRRVSAVKDIEKMLSSLRTVYRSKRFSTAVKEDPSMQIVTDTAATVLQATLNRLKGGVSISKEETLRYGLKDGWLDDAELVKLLTDHSKEFFECNPEPTGKSQHKVKGNVVYINLGSKK